MTHPSADQTLDREADVFATHLLMPSPMIRDQLGKIIHTGPQMEIGHIIQEMAKRFRVEDWRMTARLIEMKLLEQGAIRGDKV